MTVRQDGILNHLPSTLMSNHGDDMICKTCKENKEANSNNFPKHGSTRSGFDTECKTCVSIRRKLNYEKNKEKILNARRVYRKENLEKVLLSNKQYSLNNKEKRRISAIKSTYKIEEEAIVDLLNLQKGCCKICKESLVFPDSFRSYSIDHDHSTGRVRGLLCHNCNAALGLVKEDKNRLISMIQYIEECC